MAIDLQTILPAIPRRRTDTALNLVTGQAMQPRICRSGSPRWT